MARKRPSLRAMGIAALVVALAFTTTLAVREWRRADRTQSRLADQLTQRHNVEVAAGALARALVTYDYTDLGKAQGLIQQLSTGGFAQREASQAGAVQAQLRQAKASSSAVIKETSASEIDGDHATAFVILQTHSSSNGQTATNIVYMHLDLLRIGAAWKVDDVQTLRPAS